MCAGGATTQDTKRAAAGSKPNIEHKALELQEVFFSLALTSFVPDHHLLGLSSSTGFSYFKRKRR